MLTTLPGMGNHSAAPPAPTPRPVRPARSRRLTLTGALAVIGAATVLIGTAVGLVESATNAATAAIPRPTKTVVVVMENHSYSQVISAPYINSLAGQGATMTDSHGVRHPSEPNYLALWSGSTQGLTDDSCPHTYTGGSLGGQLLSSGQTVAGYSENLPAAGSTACSGSGGYARKHNPLADFPSTAGPATNKPFTAWPAADFTTLPDVSLVVPNLCNDMHDCSITTGDNWLRTHIDPFVQWAKTHNSLLILTFDEDDFTATNHIPTILVGPMVNPGSYPETINHYNVLHTIEAALGLPQLGAAAAPITDVWKVAGPTTSTPPSSAPVTTAAPTSAAPSTSPPPRSTQPSSGSPSPSPTGQPSGSALRGAFYYGWYARNWTQGSTYPATHYQPTAGFYDSTDPALIAYHIAQMRYAHLDFAIASWWGQGSQEDAAVPAELAGAADTPFKWSLYYEPEGSGDPSVSQLRSDLNYLKSKYAGNPSYLSIGGKPVLFVYGDGSDNCSMSTRWAQANQDGTFFLVLKVFPGYRQCVDQPQGWHQYGPAKATDRQGSYSYTISPGFWKYSEAAPRLTRDLTRWGANITSMVNSGASFQLVTTFNEQIEGTGIEDDASWSSDGLFGAYIEALHRLIPGSP